MHQTFLFDSGLEGPELEGLYYISNRHTCRSGHQIDGNGPDIPIFPCPGNFVCFLTLNAIRWNNSGAYL